MPRQIEFALQRALTKKLVESNTKGVNGTAAPGTHLRLTTVGAYYYRRLISMFTYVDAMLVDTPITSADFRRQIADVRPIEQRLDRAEVFASYLDDQWRAVPETEVAFDWQATRCQLTANIADIRVRASRRRERQAEAER
ncbi:MAG TPA: hypothetical protein PK867_27075 [Pirellulales bacterium]|nr:hypothetical protein [Pirellulales bacterium]